MLGLPLILFVFCFGVQTFEHDVMQREITQRIMTTLSFT